MTKIVLVNPPLKGEERYGTLATGGVYMPPLGLASLAAFIRKQGHSVKIVDCCALNLTLTDSAKAILSCDPEVVGITAATVSISKAAALAKILKEKNKNLRIIVGGSHISALPEETMKAFPQLDIGVIGEGELTTAELLNSFNNSECLDSIGGIIFRSNDSLKLNARRTFIEDLDSLPFPAWDLLPDLNKYYRPSCFGFKKLPVTSLITLRGCPMRCTFCSETPFAKTCRMHSPRYVVDMMKLLKHQYNIKDFMIYDGTFGINQPRLVSLCNLIIKEKLNIVWSCNGRIDLMSPEILRLMKHAGCWLIAYGIESGSQRILDFLQKDINLPKASQVLEWTKKEGILTKGYFMIGSPTEDEESINSTLSFALRNNLDVITVNYFTPLPGTLDYKRAALYGQFNNNWELLNHHNIVFIPSGLTAEIITSYRQKIVKKFYLRPKIIFRYIMLPFSPGSFKIIFLGIFAFVFFLFLGRKKDGPRK